MKYTSMDSSFNVPLYAECQFAKINELFIPVTVNYLGIVNFSMGSNYHLFLAPIGTGLQDPIRYRDPENHLSTHSSSKVIEAINTTPFALCDLSKYELYFRQVGLDLKELGEIIIYEPDIYSFEDIVQKLKEEL